MMDQPMQMEASPSVNWYGIWQTSYATVRLPTLVGFLLLILTGALKLK